jgi:predicted HicB family RNase H-like nuclease
MTRALNEIQTRHITALVAIEVKRTTAHSRIEEREIAGYNAAVAQSRRLAADDQPDMAQKVLNNARDEVARQRGQMHSREDDKYDHLVETEAARQTAELNGWQTNLDSQVELIHTTCNVGIQGEYKKMMVFVQRSLHRAINHTCREIKTKSLHQWVATALTQFTRHLLDLEKCGFLLPLE